jgi:hypothetical protein|tara:strand:- start:273 stop:491 length:219 start_codon:yes stop_codon:yes gene_type:complete
MSVNFTQRYISPKFIGVSDNVRYKGQDYQVLINYIKGDKDRKGFIPTENFTVLINDRGKRVYCHNFKDLEII